MFEVFLVIFAIVLFSLLVILHEYGHFIVAKRNGVEVEEFGLGFPPRLIGRTLGKGIFRGYYSLNLLPIGGFVRLKGENDTSSGKGTYGACSLYAKAKILLAGIFVNYLIAVILFTILAFIGIPKLLPTSIFEDEQFSLPSDTHIVEEKVLVSHIYDDSPALSAGLELGDQVVAIYPQGQARQTIVTSDDLRQATSSLVGQPVHLEVQRDNTIITKDVTLRTEAMASEAGTGYLGVIPTDLVLQRNTWSAPITGVVLSLQFAKVTIQGLGHIVGSLLVGDTETAKQSVTGPVGIFFILQSGAQQGLRLVLTIIALLSLTLAIMNALPIPALDGGRLALTLLFRKIIRRPLTKKLEERIVGTSMVSLLLLMVLITWVDIERFF